MSMCVLGSFRSPRPAPDSSEEEESGSLLDTSGLAQRRAGEEGSWGRELLAPFGAGCS